MNNSLKKFEGYADTMARLQAELEDLNAKKIAKNKAQSAIEDRIYVYMDEHDIEDFGDSRIPQELRDEADAHYQQFQQLGQLTRLNREHFSYTSESLIRLAVQYGAERKRDGVN